MHLSPFFFALVNHRQNLVKKRWEPGEEEEGPESAKERPMSQEDKDAVKGSILNLMCAVPADVQKQLSEALTIISEHDFPGASVVSSRHAGPDLAYPRSSK